MSSDDNNGIIQEYKNKMDLIYDDYTNNLKSRFENTNNSFSISELEDVLTNANKKTKSTFIDVTSHILNDVDEDDLVYKKK